MKNYLYALRFKNHLIDRLKRKVALHPDKITSSEIKSIETLKDFDDVYTSRAHGFRDALDYYEQCSSKQFLDKIRIPTLILSDANDSFLSESCYPFGIAKNHEFVHLETPAYGGHVGFYQSGDYYYNEETALRFFESATI